VRRVLAWVLALLPLAVGLGLWVAARAGVFSNDRLLVRASAFRGDWLLAIGALVSLLACASPAAATPAPASSCGSRPRTTRGTAGCCSPASTTS